MKRFVTGATWLAATAILVPACYLAVVVLAGPHGGVLPEWSHRLVLILAWALLFGVPIWISRIVYKQLRLRESKRD